MNIKERFPGVNFYVALDIIVFMPLASLFLTRLLIQDHQPSTYLDISFDKIITVFFNPFGEEGWLNNFEVYLFVLVWFIPSTFFIMALGIKKRIKEVSFVIVF